MNAHQRSPRIARVLRASLGTLPWLVLLPALLRAQEIRYNGSLTYAEGDYIFTDRTESISLINGLNARWSRFGISLSLPLVAQTSTAVAFLHGVPLPTGGPDHRAVRQRQPGRPVSMGSRGEGPGGQSATLQQTEEPGLVVTEPENYRVSVGDPLLSTSVEAFQGFGLLRAVAVEALVKAPVADAESGVGTGEWDYGFGGSLVFGSGIALLFADAIYWTPGDMPELELKSYLDVGTGVGLSLGERWSALVSVTTASEIIENVDPPVSASVSLSRRTRRGASLSGGASVGLSESASDFALFAGWGIELTRPR